MAPTESRTPMVYVGMVADLLHHGHVRLLEHAATLGRVVVGLLTDDAAASYKRRPLIPWAQRRLLLSALRSVSEVVPQETLDYGPNLRRLRPDVVVHGDDWRTGVQSAARAAVIEALSAWGGRLEEVPYTPGVSTTLLWRDVVPTGRHPAERAASIRPLFVRNGILRVAEVHNGLSGLLVEQAAAETARGIQRFDAMWLSSLTHATSRARADDGDLERAALLATAREVLDATQRPLVVDGDNGGETGELCALVEALEALGASALVIEDKVGPKRNSLLEVPQEQDTIEGFARKIAAARRARAGTGFAVIARIESLVLGAGMRDALERGRAYADAGADGVLIHSRARTPDEVLDFASRWRAGPHADVPLWVVPTMYSAVREDELIAAGVRAVIYANQLLRAAWPAMRRAAEAILRHGRAAEAEPELLPVAELLRLVPERPR